MNMALYAIVRDDLVENLVEWDGNEGEGETPFSQLVWPGALPVKIKGESRPSIGDGYVDGKFVPAPKPPAPPEPIPGAVTMRQARLALIDAGKYAQVNAAIHSMPGAEGLRAQVEWDFAGTVERASPIVGMMGQLLALDEEQLDNLFRSAAKL